ncbi:hypothetical protein LSTR_LSTR014004 [Laodelphax striatellus]|uniref:G-protein coupled receptors family 1 profile domain-containing protein n=1 Tax=Laodelphax striatellus TaxID=195883 RepID=A0A482WUU6_LAOST|nr:hypothetical protein LSTR_LSTR014004 [Laodelphax striatellus]
MTALNLSTLLNQNLSFDDEGGGSHFGDSTPHFDDIFSDPWLASKLVVLCVFILLTVCGNLLVIVSVVPSPHLRTPTHSLIVNLAVADLLLGITVLPLSATREIQGGAWCSAPTCVRCGRRWTSVLHGVHSVAVRDQRRPLHRRLASAGLLAHPHQATRALPHRRHLASALAISIAPPLGWREELSSRQCHVNKQLGYVIFSACGSFYLPALVIIVLYTLVYRAASKHTKLLYSGSRTTRSDVTLRVHMGSSRSRVSLTTAIPPYQHDTLKEEHISPSRLSAISSNGSIGLPVATGGGRGSDASRNLHPHSGLDGRVVKFQRQKKAAKTLGIVVGGFLLCWFPFFIILPIDAACSSCNLSAGTAFNLAFWLGYFNSCLNPVIYACSSRELRRAFLGLLCSCCSPRHASHQQQLQMNRNSLSSSSVYFKRAL